MPKKVSRFWEELKSRNVVPLMAVYTAAFFGLFELIEIISDPLDLPDWIIKAYMILKLFGFPIVFLLSWFFQASLISAIHKDSSHPNINTVPTRDIELLPDELLPDELLPEKTCASGTLVKVRIGGMRLPLLGSGSLIIITPARSCIVLM